MAVVITIPNVLGTQAAGNVNASLLDDNWNAIKDAISGLVPLVSELDDARDYVGLQGWAKGVDVASGAALTLGTDGNYFVVTGTTTITSIATKTAGTVVVLRFSGALTITHNSTTLILDAGINALTVAGDVFVFVSEGAGNWREVSRSRRLLAKSTVRKTSDFSTASGTLVSVTDLSITLTTGARRVLLIATMRCALDTAANEARFAFSVAGTDTNTIAVFRAQTSSSERGSLEMHYLTDVLAAGANVFLVRALVSGATATVTLQGATSDLVFSAIEMSAP